MLCSRLDCADVRPAVLCGQGLERSSFQESRALLSSQLSCPWPRWQPRHLARNVEAATIAAASSIEHQRQQLGSVLGMAMRAGVSGTSQPQLSCNQCHHH
jgi:hypothetical protein